jgi:hypothetical protein
MAVITLKQLKAAKAYPQQVRLFKKHFGESTTVTLAKAMKVAGLFDWMWAAGEFLTAPAWAEFERATAPAWAEFKCARAAAWAEFKRATAAAFVRLYSIKANRRTV